MCVGWVLTSDWSNTSVADGLGFIPKDDPVTCHRNFDLPRRGWLPRFGLGRHCTQDGFYVHQVPLAYTAAFVRRASNPVRSWELYRLGNLWVPMNSLWTTQYSLHRMTCYAGCVCIKVRKVCHVSAIEKRLKLHR